MAKTGKDRDMEAADQHPAFDPARPSPISEIPYFSEALSLNPLLAHPAAAMAAATAIGFGFANQMASAFFGVLQGAMEAANQQNGLRDIGASAPAEKSAASVVPAAAEPGPAAVKPKAKPVRKAAAPAAPAAKKQASRAAPTKAPVKAAGRPKAPAKPARKAASAAAAGDLKRISGIGPKLEGVLKGMGVTSLAQVAGWTDAEIARFDKELGFEGRIARDDWVGQAKALLK